MKRHNPNQPVAELHNLHVIGEGGQELLHGVDLTVERGERLLIAGPNGSGKSTILRAMEGIVKASEGEVRLFGNSMNDLSEDVRKRLIRERVGVGFQTANLDDGRTVAENIFSLHDTTRSGRPDTRRTAEILLSLGLQGKLEQTTHTLSGGEKQRAAMARLLLPNPELILLDEPTASLDSDGFYGKKHMYNVLGYFAAQSGATVVVVSHDAEAANFATREVHIRDGLVDGFAPGMPHAA